MGTAERVGAMRDESRKGKGLPRWVIAAGRWAALAALALSASPAAGKVVFEERFDGSGAGRYEGRAKVVSGANGLRGLTVDRGTSREGGAVLYPGSVAKALGGVAGTIEFWVQRRAQGEAGVEGPVLEFGNAGGKNFLTVYLHWDRGRHGGGAGLLLDFEPFVRPGYDPNVWGHEVPLGYLPAVGEWVHVAMTFGPREGDNQIRVNGRSVTPTSPLVGEEFNGHRITMKGGRLDFSGIADVKIGGDWRWNLEGANSNALSHAVVGEVRFHDEVVTAFDLSRRGDGAAFPGDVTKLTGLFAEGAAVLRWEAVPGASGYQVYRRDAAVGARFGKLTGSPVAATTYRDEAVAAGQTYRYTVYAVNAAGVESKDSAEVEVTAATLTVASVTVEKALYGAGQEIGVTLRGTPGGRASVAVAGVTRAPVALVEVGEGLYAGKIAVPAGLNLAAAALTGTLTKGGETATASGPSVGIDTVAPQAPGRVLATAPWAGEVELGWTASPSEDVAEYRVYRGVGADPAAGAVPHEVVKGTSFVDTGHVGGLEVRYAVVAVDRAGNPSARSAVASVRAVGGEGPRLASVTVEPAGKPVKPGQVLTVTVVGQAAGTATADLGSLATGLALTERGRSGTYVGSYTVRDGDVGAAKSLHRVVAKLADAYGASTLAGAEIAVIGRDALNDKTPPVIAKASHNGFQVAGFSGKLVAGDVLTVELEGEPGAYGSFDLGLAVKGVALREGKPGQYRGSYTVGWKDEGSELAVTGRLADEAGNEAVTAVGRPVSLDTRVRLAVSAKETLLPADRKTQTRLVAKATNANGDEVSGHELALTLSTTEEYTGVVGGGAIEGRQASKDDEDDLEVKWGGVTNAFGEVAATYTAGFAAKTALVIAKDLTTGDVGAGWLNTYVASTVAIELLPRAARAAALGHLTLGAEPTKLTADGRSTSRIKAKLTDLGGGPLVGQRVVFGLGNDNGRLKVLRGTTDEQGVAEAEYRAGTLMGTVTVTATAADQGVSAHVQIVLMADAPAKIELVASAERLPADGRSEATLSMRVTDIHDNPNAQVPVRLAVVKGPGSVKKGELLTDRNGEGQGVFVAGNSPGLAIVEARHTSRAPSADELRRIQGTVFVPRLAERQERDRVKVAEWLVKPGTDVAKGQALVVLEGGSGTWTLTAPEKGVLVRHVKHKRDRVELGDTLGYVEVDPEVWKDEYRQ